MPYSLDSDRMSKNFIDRTHISNMSNVNREMLELKKKIQLSEGRKKAFHEDCQSEIKNNHEEISRLKKEIGDLLMEHKESQNEIANLDVETKRLETIVGPLNDKNGEEIKELLDLHIIDKTKHLDLLRYRIGQRKKHLTKIGQDYYQFASKTNGKRVEDDNEPIETLDDANNELQNKIHEMEVQLRENSHVQKKYKDIERFLQNDTEKFEIAIRNINEDIERQKIDIEKLQKVVDEASRMRNAARRRLIGEEREVTASAASRDRQLAEGRRLVACRRRELEQLEKRIFQSGRFTARHEPDTGDDAIHTDEDVSDNVVPTRVDTSGVDDLTKTFDVLKKVTGAIDCLGVLEKFKTQKDTSTRLDTLKTSAEGEKIVLEKRLEALGNELERLKLAEMREVERRSCELEKTRNLIELERERSQKYIESKMKRDGSLKAILNSLRILHLSMNPLAIPQDNALQTLEGIKHELQILLAKMEKRIDEDEETVDVDDKWLPTPYGGLVRRTPLSQQGMSPAPQAPEEEEEVPSRSYLKRQAQLVVDAKSRRKNAPKRN